MSATVERNTTSSWRKRRHEEDQASQMERKRPRCYYFRLESESSRASEEDTESVYSLQDRETDVVRDTSDTDSKSECSDQREYELIEYECASLSGSDDGIPGDSSSGSDEDQIIFAAAVEAICDSSLDTWITDCEESDNSSLDDSVSARSDFARCVQCKSENDNPLYRYCEKCFQQSCRQCKMGKTYKCFPLCISCHKNRKKFFPPRPKGYRKTRKLDVRKERDPPVKLATLRSCLSGLSQDSGIGSSQDCPPLDLDQIIVPDEHLRPGTSKLSPITEKLEEIVEKTSTSTSSTVAELQTERKGIMSVEKMNSKRKRQESESSLSDFEIKRSKPSRSEKSISLSQTSDLGSEISPASFSSSTTEKSSENSELCIICNSAPKDSIFLHTNIGHQCCCYKCAKRTLHTIKRCPICNRSVNKIVRIYTS